MTSDYHWRYRCSICQEIIRPEDVRSHTEAEKAKPTWPGHMTWSRVDLPEDEAEAEHAP